MSLQPDPTWRPRPNYRPRPAPPRRSGFGMLVVSGLALFGVGVGYLFMTMRDNAPGVSGMVPTIQAEATPFKIRPDNPGGIEVLHQDSTVFDAMNPEAKRAKQEQLLPQPEQPDDKLLAQAAVAPEAAPTAEVLAARSEPLQEVPPAADASAINSAGSVALPSFNAETPAAAAAIAAAVPEAKQVIEQAVPAAVVEGQKTESLFVQELKDTPKIVEIPALEPAKSEEPAKTETPIVKAESAAKVVEAPKPRAETAKTTVKKAEKSETKTSNKQQAKSKKEPAAKSEENLDIADILARTDAVNLAKEEKLAALAPKAEIARPEPSITAKPAALGSGGMRVQLASSPDQTAAEKLKATIVNRHGGLLRQSKLSLVRAELAGKGIYYRIQTQSMSMSEAKDLCASLKAAGQSCLVVKSGSQ